MTRVLIASASAVVRAGLEAVIASSSALEVAGTFPSVAALTRQHEVPAADVLLVDLDRIDETTLPNLRALGAEAGSPALVILTGPDADIAEDLRLGARGVLPREAEAGEILAAVEAAAAGLVVLHPDSVEPLLPHLVAPSSAPPNGPAEDLTPREIEVLSMLAEGAGNKLIARRLGISEHTVKFHVGSILAKLNASSRTEAVTTGIRQGLIMV